jgi:penicillin-binding protein 1A
MDIRSHILRFRRDHQQKNRSNPLGSIGLLVTLLISLISAGGVIYGVYRYAQITDELPPPDLMERLLDPPDGSLLEPTRIYDRSGQVLLWQFENPLVQYRHYASITDGSMLFFHEVSEDLINAVLAARDPGYLSRPETFLESIWDNRPDPIPRTLVEELLLWDEVDHPYRELRVNLLADQIVARFGREKVLEWYLNSAYFGNQIYGIEQAARIYFGKSAADLDLAESALLAGVASYPSLNPYDSPEAAKENQESILASLAEVGLITRGERDRAIHKDLIYPDPEAMAALDYPGFVDYLLTEAEGMIPRENLIRGGYKIISTLDSSLQDELGCTAELMISRTSGLDPELDPDCEASRLLPKYSGPDLDGQDSLEINLVVLDPLNGELLGMLGINDQGGFTSLDRPRYPGTALTPFLYLNYFTQGFEPASLVWDIPLAGASLNDSEMHPGCSQDCDFKGPVNVRTALLNDYLSPAQQLWESQGINQIKKTLVLFGFSLGADSCQDCVLFPGSPQLDLIDLAQGYGVFVNQGFLRGRKNGSSSLEVQPASILSIEDRSGWFTVPDSGFVGNKIISEQLAFMVNHVLSDETVRENGDIFRIGRPAGVKTGYVPGSGSAWVIGYTPRAVIAVWAGNPQGGGLSVDTTQISSDLWRAITQHISRGQDSNGWEMPAGMITLDVCYPSGQLPSQHCPREVREIFIEGNQPQSPDTLFQVLEVNRETGLLASVFTPVRMIEERVYLDFPPEALTWAEGAGLAAPPTLYDLDSSDSGTQGLFISRPENLSFVNGRVRIVGTIPEEGFQSARLQYGLGMNPGSWLQIGPEITAPADNVWLGSWDTSKIADGVYAMQLVLIKENQQVEKFSLVVSVDNTPPEIILKSDLSEGMLVFEHGKEVIIEVEFENSSEIRQVDFYLDGQLLSSRKTTPYLHLWLTQIGSHELTITAVDQAGNRSDLTVQFDVQDD